MASKFQKVLRGDGMKARTLRGTALSVLGFGGSQFIRLASNLVLTRLLFPEVFGLMALIQVFIVGLGMFSDMSINQAIIQSKRGEEPAFLNTGWTIQIIRGLVLWILACLLAAPVAEFYGQESIKEILPIVALSTIIGGFKSTKMPLANRNLLLGRYTFVELGGQIIGTIVMILAAWSLRSVWALVIGSLTIFSFTTIFSHLLLPGPRNRVQWDKPAFWEYFHFGKFLFFSTIAGFFVQQGDRLVLGKFVSLEDLAVFTIAFLFGNLALTLNYQINQRILLPLYRKRPPADSDNNYKQIARVRFGLVTGFLSVTALLAFGGELLIEILYDSRYYAAGPLLVLLSLSIMPSLVGNGYKQILLANGNSRDFMTLTAFSAVTRISLLVILIPQFGIVGAILAPFLVDLMSYPLIVHFSRRYRGWYPGMDIGLLVLCTGIAALALWLSPSAAEQLLTPLGWTF
ncbi:MAG: oligosaccharide flippase family protein [Pseudomonadota bacterium]